MTWTCCGTGRCAGCSLGSGRPRRWAAFLRAFTFGHVRQLDAVAARFTAGLARHAPLIAPRAEVTYLDVDDTMRATYGYAQAGAAGTATAASKA